MRDISPLLISMVAASVATVVGIAATILGIAFLVMGFPVAWLAWLGAALTLAAIATRYLLARTIRPTLDRTSQDGVTTIYMPLLNEGTNVWRPVEAMKITDLGYMVTEPAPPDEEWAFQPGHILRCEERSLNGQIHLVAVGKAT